MSKKIDEVHYENIYTRNVNFRERVIYLNEDIDEAALEIIEKAMDEMEREPEKEVRIRISSYGGYIYDALAIIDRLEASPCPIVTIGLGKVMSAATLIMACGDKRVAGQNTFFMIHEGSSEIEGKTRDLKVELAHINDLEDLCSKLYERFSEGKVSAKEWKRWQQQKDFYFRSDKAKEFGLIDSILGEE